MNESIVAAGVAPAFDAADVGPQLAQARGIIGPDIAVATNAVGAGISLGGPDVEGRGAVNRFLEGGGNAGEFVNVVTPLGADDVFPVAGHDAAEEVVNESCVSRGVGGG